MRAVRIKEQIETPVQPYRLLHSGAEFFECLEQVINSAENTIHFQTYIFREDNTGMRIRNALVDAARRGVNVYLVLDAVGTPKISTAFKKLIAENNIHFKWFAPLLSSHGIRFGRRMHHKLVVVDSKHLITGGINISDHYSGADGEIPWLDFGIYLRGAVAADAEAVCQQILEKSFFDPPKKAQLSVTDPAVKLRCNDRLRGKNEISASYQQEFRRARKSITIVCSYFLPGTRIMSALKKAAKRGVEIKIILSGTCDVPLIRTATNHLYKQLLENNIRVFEWRKSMLHGKLAVIDESWVSVGSFNLNHLSALGSIEANVEIKSGTFARQIQLELEEIMNGCVEITYQSFMNEQSRFYHATNRLCYFSWRYLLRFVGLFPDIMPSKKFRYNGY